MSDDPSVIPSASPKVTPPFAVGETVEARVEDLAFGGEGVARIGGFVLFVPFVLPGERVKVEVIEVKKSFGRGRLLEILEASPDRVEPRCAVFGACGGCQYQHLAYPVQTRIKTVQIQELFRRVGGFSDPPVRDTLPCPSPFGYRNRIMVRSQWDPEKGRMKTGFLRYDNRRVVDVETCHIAEPSLQPELDRVRDNPPERGGIKTVLRLAPDDWDVHPDSFFQNNFHLLPELVRTVGEQFSASGMRFLVDVYCGVGFFGISLADRVERFVGIELDRRAIRSAERNARDRGVENGEFLEGQAEKLLPALVNRFPAAETTVLLDPPRKGCYPETLELLRQVGPGQILYVSCHPATLARDVKQLCEGDVYRLDSVTPLDMFPQTQHVECVADLRRMTVDASPEES